ncbi:hypothetical protein CJ030_MR0G015470 [Morella rubra]|uniref:Uncharacterized protein n=1 Tax=Morella rubra TaxID=262757 RepID=A0A6A1UKN7_9ROSI|nr:hypothetical protein CJ030_MR0G015470 [Morella rubra]
MRRESPINVDRRHKEEFPLWFRNRSAINKQNRAKLKIVHTLGARSFQHARALLEKMEALQLQHESEGKSYTKVEIFAEVLGTKAGYVRGLGRSVRASVKRSDMEQTMREHLQMMEEQQRKKDEELMQMMVEQQGKKTKSTEDDGGATKDLVEQQEQRMQLMAEQMREQLVEQIRQLQSRSTPKRKFG